MIKFSIFGTVLLIILKIAKVISISWLWVFSPIWITIIFLGHFGGIFFIYILVKCKKPLEDMQKLAKEIKDILDKDIKKQKLAKEIKDILDKDIKKQKDINDKIINETYNGEQ